MKGNVPQLSTRQFLFKDNSGTYVVDLSEYEKVNCGGTIDHQFSLCLDTDCISRHDKYIRLRGHTKLKEDPVCKSMTWEF